MGTFFYRLGLVCWTLFFYPLIVPEIMWSKSNDKRSWRYWIKMVHYIRIRDFVERWMGWEPWFYSWEDVARKTGSYTRDQNRKDPIWLKPPVED